MSRAPRRRPAPPALAVCLLAAVCSSAAVPSTARAQAPNGDASAARDGSVAQETFFDSLAVHVVNVDVYVTDKKGDPVTGLSRDDFELFEDGRPVELSNFYAVEGDRRRPRALPPASAPTSPRADPLAAPLAAEPAPEDQRLYLIVYLDNLFLKPFSRNKVIREVNRFLHFNLDPDDRVMLVTFNRTLRVAHPFTTDPELVIREMEKVETHSALAQQLATERRLAVERIDRARDILQAQTHADSYAKSLHNDVLASLRGLKELVGSLGGLPGRKAVLYVSEGLPMTAGEDLFALIDTRFGKVASSQLMANRYRVRRDFRELVDKANANRVTFYTLDAAGNQAHQSLSAEYGRSDASYIEVDFTDDMNRRETLMVMADGTGGRATLGTNNFTEGLERMASDFDTYYSLGYVPAHQGEGRYHTIEVKVKRRGLQVRHRAGYRDKTLESRVSDGTLAALLYGAAVNPLDVAIALGRPRPSDRQGRWLVPIEIRIPLARVALLPRGEERQGLLRVSVAVLDEDGDTSTPAQEPFPIVVPEAELEQARTRHFTYTAELLMRRGTHQLAVGVVDEIGGESSFLREPVRVDG